MKSKHVQPNLPTLTCHHCGYDMHDRKEHDPCPECGTPFDIRPDAFRKNWSLTRPILWLLLGMILMPKVYIFAFVFMFPAYNAYDVYKRMPDDYRVPKWVHDRYQAMHLLAWLSLLELFVLIILNEI